MKLSKIIITLLIFCSVISQAQVVNLLDGMQINDISLSNWEEKGTFYYCLRIKNPSSLGIFKYNKYSLQPVDSLTLISSTNDTVYANDNSAIFCTNNEGEINIMYRKKSLSSGAITGTYFLQTDLDFNITVNEKWLPIFGSYRNYAPSFTGGIIYATINTQDSSGSQYSMLYNINKYGEISKSDTAGFTPIIPNQIVNTIVPYQSNTNRYLIIGKNLAHISTPVGFDLYISDSSFNIIDTFQIKKAVYTSFMSGLPYDATILPNKDVVFGITGGMGSGYNTIIAKAKASNRFTITYPNEYKSDLQVDSIDFCHQRGSLDCVKYNPYDHLIYFVTVTHRKNNDYISCVNPTLYYLPYYDHNYAQITCLDTGMNLQWIKNIRFNFQPGYCVDLGQKVAVPDGRSGIIFSGYGYINFTDTLPNVFKEFVYYVNENTATDTTINLSVINHSNNNQNEVSVYPNPTNQTITIANRNNTPYVSVMILDMNGRNLIKKEVPSYQYKIRINISSLANGMYIIKALDKDGISFYSKFVKE